MVKNWEQDLKNQGKYYIYLYNNYRLIFDCIQDIFFSLENKH